MDRHAAMDPDVTVSRFRNADGTPKAMTRTVNGQTRTASDWVLVTNPTNPDQFVWAPL